LSERAARITDVLIATFGLAALWGRRGLGDALDAAAAGRSLTRRSSARILLDNAADLHGATAS
jgi:hypothetical protein